MLLAVNSKSSKSRRKLTHNQIQYTLSTEFLVSSVFSPVKKKFRVEDNSKGAALCSHSQNNWQVYLICWAYNLRMSTILSSPYCGSLHSSRCKIEKARLGINVYRYLSFAAYMFYVNVQWKSLKTFIKKNFIIQLCCKKKKKRSPLLTFFACYKIYTWSSLILYRLNMDATAEYPTLALLMPCSIVIFKDHHMYIKLELTKLKESENTY